MGIREGVEGSSLDIAAFPPISLYPHISLDFKRFARQGLAGYAWNRRQPREQGHGL